MGVSFPTVFGFYPFVVGNNQRCSLLMRIQRDNCAQKQDLPQEMPESTTIKAAPKLYDVIVWILPQVKKFPRTQKFTLGDRIVNPALDTLELLIEATYTR